VIGQYVILQPLLLKLASHSSLCGDNAMKPRSILWRRRSRQGFYGSLAYTLALPFLLAPARRRRGVLPLGFHRGKLSLFNFGKPFQRRLLDQRQDSLGLAA
jgi:hypothetical protein